MNNESQAPNPCLNLRSKDMYYKVRTELDAEQEAVVARLYGTVDTRAYWCHCTQAGRGPDDRPVNREECSKAGRKCYTGLEHLA
jgi:hypothetical protein